MRALFGTETPQSSQSFIHRLDVRTKMGVSLLASLAVVLLSSPWALGVLFFAGALYALSMKRYGILLIAYGIVVCMWGAAIAMMAGMHALWPSSPAVEPAKLLGPFLRTGVMVNVVLALALSSRIQPLLAALKTLRLPFCIYIPLAVMIRFLPTFIEDVRQISESIRTRGHRLTPVGILARPWLTVRLLMMPLLFRSLRSSDELGIAAELKGLGDGQRMTPLGRSSLGREDALMACLTIVVLVAGGALQMVWKGGSGGMI